MLPRRSRVLALASVVATQLACNQLLGIESASVGCVSDEHCAQSESCLASVCQALRPEDAGSDAGDAAASQVAASDQQAADLEEGGRYQSQPQPD